jgi:hypothetical protein
MNTIIPSILELLGTLLIAMTALRVHHRVLGEHKIDKLVYKAMRKEQYLGIFGVTLLIVAFLLEIIFVG